MTIGCYQRQSVQDRVVDFLRSQNENPISIEDISYALKLDKDTVYHVIHSVQEKHSLCEKNGKFYLPNNKMRWWMVAFVVVIIDVLVFCELIKYYHV